MTEKFKGFPYPIVTDGKGYFHTQSGTRQIKSDLLILLLTNPNERVMLPSFGTPLKQLVFEPNDISLQTRAREIIIAAIREWEPRITIEQIEVTSNVDSDALNFNDDRTEMGSILMITIRFLDPDNIQTIQELKLEVPLGGGF
jgi:phage baseplate assembly protein W